jgi:tetratricopeptide (TPR) repeat protein
LSVFPWESLLDQLELELASSDDPERRAAICCRLALLHWDVRGDRTSAEHWIGRVEHPSGAPLELRRQLLLDAGEATAAATLVEERAASCEPGAPEKQRLLLQAALIWLFWVGDAARTVKCCREAGRPLDRDLAAVFELALVLSGETELLVALAVEEDAAISTLVAAALALRERPDEAADLLERAAELDDEDPLILELRLEVTALQTGRLEERVALMAKKLAILAHHGPRRPETLGLAFDLSRLKGELGQREESARLLHRVDPSVDDLESTNPVNLNPMEWSSSLLRLAKRDHAVRAGDDRQLEQVYRSMAEAADIPALGRVYRLRTAQLLGAAEGRQAQQLLRENLQENPEDPRSAVELERLLLRSGEMERLCALYQQQAEIVSEGKGLLLRKAAILAEAHLGNQGLAAGLRRDCLALDPDPLAHGDLQRLFRALQSGPRLMEAYQREADAAVDTPTRSLLLSVLGALRLKLGQVEEAEASAREALEVMPDDPLALAVLVSIYDATGKDPELRDVLQRQSEVLASPSGKAGSLVRLAGAAAAGSEARALLEQAIELRPGDPAVLGALLQFSEDAGDQERAVHWGLELAQAVEDDASRAAAAYVRVGRLYDRLDKPELAAPIYERALSFDGGSEDAMEGLSGIHRRAGELEALAKLLERRIEQIATAGQCAGLWLELAHVREELGGQGDAVVEAFARAAEAEEHRAVAVEHLDRTCREVGKLERLVELLLALPKDGDTLERLARAMTDQGDLDGLAEVLGELVALSEGDVERADRTYDLGRVLEQLGRGEEAIERFEQALDIVPRHRPALHALQRLYGTAEAQGSNLLRVLELELESETDPTRRVGVLCQLAEQLERAGQKGMAAIRLEEALALQPDNLEVIVTLERLYDPNHPLELARVLALHGEIEADPKQQAQIFLRAGELYTSGRLVDEALPVLRRAFLRHPANRTVFTTYEALCYEQERWPDLMELYDRAIHFVEHEDGKAYRPLDLFVRKGQLQLNNLGQPGEAVASLLQALEQDPKSESVMKLLESIYLQEQDWRGLIRTYEHRATLVPGNELFRLESLRQAARLATGRLPASEPEARKLWEQVYSIDPTDEEALDNLERIFNEQELHDKLADLLDTRLALAVADEDVIALNLRLAEICEKQLDDPVRAAKAFERVRRLEEHHEESLKSLARIYEATGQWQKCVEALQDLVIMEADPNERSLLYFKCGSIMETQFHEDEEAISYYEAALNETPACLPAIHGLRDLYLRREEWNRALDTLELEVQLWEEGREQAGVLARMGEIRLHHLKDLRAAVDLFEDALAIDGDCRPAAVALFDLSYERGDSKRALEMGERLVARMAKEGDPQQRSRFFCRRGQLLAAGGDVATAVESLVTALDLRPDNLEALDWLIAICRRTPEAYDFATIFRDLEQVYRREENRAAVGHVLVAAGALSEIAGDAETALARYQEAMEAAPQEMAPVKSLANLLVRIRRPREGVAVLEKLVARAEEVQVQVRALLRIGEIWSDVEPDPSRAIEVYQRVLALDPENREAMFRLAQEHYVQGRLDEAHRRMTILLDRTLAVDGRSRPAALSDYAHYMGVVLARMGDSQGAERQFQYALQLADDNVHAAMALARQMEQAGDGERAERMLTDLLKTDRTVNPGAPEVRRTLAAHYLKRGEVQKAVQQYETLVNESGKVEDRIALAEIHAERRGSVEAARAALMPALEGDRFNPHALQLLAALHEQSNEQERTLRVLQVMEMLGWADRDERVKLTSLRRQFGVKPSTPLDDGLRGYLGAFSSDRFVERVWEAVREPLERLFPLEMPEASRPASEVGHAEFRQLAEWCVNFVAESTAVLVADSVPGGSAADTDEGGRVLMDRLFLERPAAEVAFVLGRNLGYLRSGHALLSRLAFDDRALLGELLGGLLQTAEEQQDLAKEFRRGMSRRMLKQLDDIAAAYQESLAADGEENLPARWFAGVDRTANNTGLVACNDVSAALRMMAQLGGQDLAVGPRGEIAVQLVTDGPELVQFFLSDNYTKLRRRLANP